MDWTMCNPILKKRLDKNLLQTKMTHLKLVVVFPMLDKFAHKWWFFPRDKDQILADEVLAALGKVQSLDKALQHGTTAANDHILEANS